MSLTNTDKLNSFSSSPLIDNEVVNAIPTQINSELQENNKTKSSHTIYIMPQKSDQMVQSEERLRINTICCAYGWSFACILIFGFIIFLICQFS